eukprot:Opistho-1_new@50427
MGCSPSYPLDVDVVRHVDQRFYSSTGSLHSALQAETVRAESKYALLQRVFWQKLIEHREKLAAIKKSLEEMDYKEIAARWPQFKEGEIAVFHLQFKTCDLNNDGRIDLYELNYMLDEMEDPTTREERKRLFDEIDRDGSGGVDFDEFLGLVELVQSGKTDPNTGFGALFTKTAIRATRLAAKLNVGAQLESGLI